ncbi:glycosyltransferase family 4 protein [Clostridium perfringens]|nr:glycosyltransferase family 4 protein [Clostridium perfringens]
MKIAFILDSIKEKIDYSNYTVPNPGIGGTQFLIWTVSSNLAERNNGLDIYIFSEKKAEFSKSLNVIQETDVKKCIKICAELQIDYLVLRGPFIKKEIFDLIDKYEVKTVMWSHNFENYITLKNSKSVNYLKKNICVSYEQLDLLRDTDLYSKSTTIYNGINFSCFDDVKVKLNRYRVCYIGNLYPHSGYETIINAWKKVEERFPQAELIIIGGNNLYNIEKMKSGYSKKSFENLKKKENQVFLDDTGKLKSNIKFIGVCGGIEKLKIMASSYVGVANITLAGDTFGLSVVEFQALGVPVVSINKYGVRETVSNNKTGILVDKNSQLADGICRLLENEDLRNKYSIEGKKFVRKNFSIDKIILDWEDFFSNVNADSNLHIRDNLFTYDGKRKVLLNAKIRSIPIFKKFPPILFYKYLIYGFKRVLQKLNLI